MTLRGKISGTLSLRLPRRGGIFLILLALAFPVFSQQPTVLKLTIHDTIQRSEEHTSELQSPC